MSAQILAFPATKKRYVANNQSYRLLKGVPVQEPETRSEYLSICKTFLDPMDYQDILCGIMDSEHYDALEPALQRVVNSYYDFPS